MRTTPIVIGVLGVAIVAGGVYMGTHKAQQGTVLALDEPAP